MGKIISIFVAFVIFLSCMVTTNCLAFDNKNIPVASDFITFEQNFDSNTALAAMASGDSKPIHVFGKLDFRKGLSGNALFCGKDGGRIRYSLKDNIDFGKPGTVSFWFFADNWKKGIGYPSILFFAIDSTKGYLGAQTANDPKTISPLEREIRLQILYSSVISNCSLALPAIGFDGDNKWHLLVLAWNDKKIFISLDGGIFSSKDLSNSVSVEAFPSSSFSIGSHLHQDYLLDEFIIYSKKLSDMEVAEMWKKGNDKINDNNIIGRE